MVFLFGTLGMATGGSLGGVIYDWTATYRLAFLTGIGFNLANLVLVSFMVPRQGSHSDRDGRLLPAAA